MKTRRCTNNRTKSVFLTKMIYSSILVKISIVIIFILSMVITSGQAKPHQKDLLTPIERQWLVEHDRLIRIGITEIPVQILRGDTPGNYKGLSIDYIKLLERNLRCKFKLVYYKTWNEVMQAAQNKEIDMIFAAQKTPERSKYLLFSRPYIELPNMIIVRKNMKGLFALPMMTGLKIACSEGSAVHEFLREKYGYLDLYPVTDELSGLIKLSFGEVDAMVVELSRASYYIEKAQITNLRVAGSAGLKYELRFASRKDWPILNSILNKGLSSITDQDREIITRKWITVGTTTIFASRAFWISLGTGFSFIILIFIGVISWNRTLKRQVAQRTGQLQEQLSERQRAEEALAKKHLELQETAQRLEQSRNLLQLIIESIPVRVFWKDRDSRFLGCNTLFAHDAGLSQPEELLGQDDFAMGWREQAELYRADDRQVMESGRPKMNIVEPQTTPSGAKIWLNTSKVPLQMPSGEVFGVLGVYEDITARKQAEEALRQVNETLRATLDAAPVAIIDLDTEGRIKSLWNPAAEEMLGWRREEVLGHFLPTVPEDSKEEFAGFRAWVRSGKSIIGKDVVRRRKDGSPIEYSLYAAPEYDANGKVAGNIAVLVDITERKRAEQQSAQLAAIVQSSDDAIISKTLEGIITSWNMGAKNIYGYGASEVVGQPISILVPPGHEDDVPQILAKIKSGAHIEHFESVRRRKDGNFIHVSITVSPIRDAAGKIIAASTIARDITEQKRAEEALRKSAAEIHDLYNRAPCGYHSLNADGVFVQINDTELQWLGYTRDEIVGKKRFVDLISERGLASFQDNFPQFKTRGWVRDLEYEIIRKDGAILPVLLSASAVTDPDGNFVMSRGTIYNLTERKRAENIMQKRLRLLEFANTHSLDELLTATLDEIETLTGSAIGFYHFLEEDQKTLSLQNWSTNTLQNMCTATGKGSHYDIDQAGVWVDCIHERRPVIHNDYASLPHRKGMPEGHAPVVREAVVPIFRGNLIKAIIGVGNKANDYNDSDIEIVSQLGDLSWDIVERKRAEEALRESEKRYRIVADNTYDWEFWTNPDGQFLYTSPSCQRITGHTAEEFGLDPGLLNAIIHPEDRKTFELHRQKVKDQMISGEEEMRILLPDGSLRYIAHACQPVFDDQGLYLGKRGSNRDITERKQAEEEIRKLNLELEQRVRDRTAQLEAANQELEAFAYSVSHDLRAPLRHVDGFLELLQKRTTKALDAKSEHYMGTILDSTRRMGTLIDDLLSFSRMGRWEMLKKPVDLNVLVQEVIQEFEPETRGRSIHWQIADLPVVIGDHAMLRLALVNLISNALKFTRPRPETEIGIGYRPGRDNETIFFIRDNGVGFDMKYADNLFGVFQRLHRIEEFEGTGIGLANVRRIIHRHGGRTWAEGKINQGATFYFSLPQTLQGA
jgi:PAS domain S-box-containing protein